MSLQPSRLLLYTRVGCCLCEGLAERLRALQPPPALELVDIDTDPALRARFDLEVPVLAVQATAAQSTAGHAPPRQLPRVPPRLAGGQLRQWLKKQGAA
jgi:hypothetical protein